MTEDTTRRMSGVMLTSKVRHALPFDSSISLPQQFFPGHAGDNAVPGTISFDPQNLISCICNIVLRLSARRLGGPRLILAKMRRYSSALLVQESGFHQLIAEFNPGRGIPRVSLAQEVAVVVANAMTAFSQVRFCTYADDNTSEPPRSRYHYPTKSSITASDQALHQLCDPSTPPHAMSLVKQVRSIQAGGLLLLGWAARGDGEGSMLPSDVVERCLALVVTAQKLHSMDVAIKSHGNWAKSNLQLSIGDELVEYRANTKSDDEGVT